MIIPRSIQSKVETALQYRGNDRRVIVIYGARQVGKTTLVKELIKTYQGKAVYYNCDYPDVQQTFSYENAGSFSFVVQGTDLLILDEAQRIRNIGMVLKILHDEFPGLQIIATGSSSFELSNEINEPLTGRKIIFKLLPLGFGEVTSGMDNLTKRRLLPKLLRFGSYPDVYLAGEEQARERLSELSGSYLFKDLLNFQDLRKPELLNNLLKLLAFQIGHEVSFTELSNNLGIDQTVIQRYLGLLEETFIVFRLPALKRNLRNETGKTRKVYFWDLGIRNILIQNTNSLDFRNDLGQLWENFCISERFKMYHNDRLSLPNSYFWRTYSQKEIDLVEEKEGWFSPFEFKWTEKKTPKIPPDFDKSYPNHGLEVVNPSNFMKFLDPTESNMNQG